MHMSVQAPAPGADAATAPTTPLAAGSTQANAAAPATAGRKSFGNLPDEDDGVSCLLVRLPSGWGVPRLQAFIERFGPKPKEVSSEWLRTLSLSGCLVQAGKHMSML